MDAHHSGHAGRALWCSVVATGSILFMPFSKPSVGDCCLFRGLLYPLCIIRKIDLLSTAIPDRDKLRATIYVICIADARFVFPAIHCAELFGYEMAV